MGVSTLHLMIALAIHGAAGQQTVAKPGLTLTSTPGFINGATNVKLTCATITMGSITYSMTMDGKPVTDGFAATTGILTIPIFATATHTGLYKCKATLGADTSDESDGLKVAVQGAPDEPTLGSAPTIFVIDESVIMTCTSQNAVGFKWYKDGTEKPGQTGNTLTLAARDEKDGDYTCRGLTGDSPPLYSLLSNVVKLEAAECKAKEQCTTNPKNQCDATNNKCVECLVKAHCASKSGKEQCDIAGTKTCVAFSAKVTNGGNDVGSSVQVKGRTSVTLTCDAGPATTAPTYKWEDDAGVVTNGAVNTINTIEVGKKYTCKASKREDATGPIANTEAEVTLTDKLNVVIKKDDASGGIVSGKNVDLKGLNKLTLFCEAGPKTGSVTYKWKDGKDDDLSGGDYDISPGTLLIKKPANKAGMKIKCEATDKGSNAEGKSAKVTLIKSGSTNVQMSYLMLGLVTLVSAVWSGRVC